MASWSDLPPELLGLVIAKIPNPVVRVRSHAVCRVVCRAWHSAARHHHAATAHQSLPLIMLVQDGYFLDPSDGCSHRLPSFPDDDILIGGSTDGWLVLGHGSEYIEDYSRKYHLEGRLLHNPFSHTSVPLNELDAAMGSDSTIRKFLMRSTTDDFFVVLTSDRKCPLVVFRPGKGAWSAEPHAAAYMNTIDLAFLGDKLYGITKAEDLISLDLGLDGNGTPMAFNYKRVIRQPLGHDDDDALTDSEEEEKDEDNYDGEEGEENKDGDDEDDAATTVEEQDGDDEDDAATTVEEQDGDDEDDAATMDEEPREEDNTPISGGCDFSNDEETKETIITTRNLVESGGKLLMVRRQIQMRKPAFTRQVVVFEADTKRGAWVPLPVESGLGGGRALFVGSSIGFSKSVSTPHGEVEEDTIYFVDTGEVFNMKSRTSTLPQWLNTPPEGMAWLYPPELVL